MTIKHITIELDKLGLYPKNPRQGDVAAVKESLRTFGQFRTIVVRPETWLVDNVVASYQVLAGNHTLLAARELGLDSLDCTVVDVDDDTAARIVLADNRSSDRATYDDTELLSLLQSLDTLEGTGYETFDLDELSAELEESLKPPRQSATNLSGDKGITIPTPEGAQFGSRDAWENATRRIIVLDYSIEDFLEVTALFTAAASAFGTSNNTETVLALLRRTVDDGR